MSLRLQSATAPAPYWRRVLFLIEAGAFFALMGFFHLIGLDAASATGGAIARAIGPWLRVSKRARENLRACLPHLDEKAREKIVLAMWENLGRTFAEYPHLHHFKAFEEGGRLEVVHREIAEAARAKGKGFVMVSGHFANWELLPIAARQCGIEGAIVYRAANNPYVDRWLVRQRERNAFPDPIAKGAEGARRIVTLLRRGQMVCMLADQKMNDGLAVPFFGRDAMTATAPGQLALRYGAPLIPACIERLNGARFRATAYPPLEMPMSGDKAADLKLVLTRMNEFLEARIRERPEQWLWLHRRWPKPGTPAGRMKRPKPASAAPPAADRAAPETN